MKNIISLLLIIFFSGTIMNVCAQDGSGSPFNSLSNGVAPDGTDYPSDSLSMAGWHLESMPKVLNSDMDSGMISYQILIDGDGELLSINVLKQTISDELAKKCLAEIRKMNFVRNANNTSDSSTSKGTLTFIFRVK